MPAELGSQLQSQDVKTITDADDAIVLNNEEKQLLDQANGRVLLFYLSRPMIFGVSKAIAREHSAMVDSDVLILYLSDVPMLGVTASLAIENAIKDACDQGRHVLVVGAAGKVKQRLEKFGIARFVPSHHFFMNRVEALKQALALINPYAVSGNVASTSEYRSIASDTDTYGYQT